LPPEAGAVCVVLPAPFVPLFGRVLDEVFDEGEPFSPSRPSVGGAEDERGSVCLGSVWRVGAG
jgi:hypothetical protein